MKNTKHIDNLFELLEIPTISAQSVHNKDIQKACKWLQTKLKTLGFKSSVLPTDGHPVVFAENMKAGKDKPTVLVYGHYDVQAPDPLNEWKSEPFKPEIRNGNIYGRGTADDKGQLYTWIAACEEILENDKKLPINIKFLIEGEEEVGSVNLDKFVKKNIKLLKADICVISDSHSLSETQPVITYGLRGLVYAEVIIKSLAKDAHSGLYGGNVLNPANVLSQIISKLKDDKHKILVPGFYNKVRKLSSDEVKALKKFPFTKNEVMHETGAKTVEGEKEYSTQERLGSRPTLDVNGMWGGYQGEGPKTIIPAYAGAKISMRLVPSQSSEEIFNIFEKYVKKICPKGVEISVKNLSGGEPILMDISSKYFKSAENAFLKTFKSKPLYELSGGSIPVTATFKTLMGIDSLLMGYGLPDDGLHSPNEKLSLKMFQKGIETNIEFLKSL